MPAKIVSEVAKPASQFSRIPRILAPWIAGVLVAALASTVPAQQQASNRDPSAGADRPASSTEIEVAGSGIGRSRDLKVRGVPVEPTGEVCRTRVVNVRDVAFSVVWGSDAPEVGFVRYGVSPAALDQVACDLRDAEAPCDLESDTHFVTVNGLEPQTTYYVEVVRGQQAGELTEVRTGRSLPIPPSNTVFGQTFLPDGSTFATGSYVCATLQDGDQGGSPGLAVPECGLITDEDGGFWDVNLGNARSVSLGRFEYSPETDLLREEACGAVRGCAIQILGTPAEGAAEQQPDLLLDPGSDSDEDGVTVCAGDCDDTAREIFPGAQETCDGLDNDCNGLVDETYPVGQTCTVGVGECAAEGSLVCSEDGAGTVCDGVPGEPTDELCDELDNNCNGEIDEGFAAGEICTVGVGECAAIGTLVCSEDGTASVCDAVPGEPTDEICDGFDNNCNGETDEGFDLGGTCTEGIGECAAEGMLVCSADGTTSVCDAVPGEPTAEVCDGLDNNCNGETDEGFDLGGTCTAGVGECAAEGMLVCSADGTTSVCDAVPGEPTDELCDGFDNNCNGETDEGFDLGGTCTAGVGECAAEGMLVCSADGTTSVCDAVPGEPTDELCDGLDNNCNAETDEGFDLGGTCTAGVGECAAEGMLVCSADGTTSVCDAVPGEPTDELCDGFDNNCNGETDEGFDLGGTCTAGVGECAAEGMLVCSADGTTSVCDAVPGEPTDELCDGLDNNCNGETDEGFDLGGTCTAGVGECAAEGMLVCSADGTTAVCDAVPGEPTDELCDGLDNNCNGEIDEGFDLGGTCTAGVGECAAEGMLVCSADGTTAVCDAVPGEPTDELCDGLDNNCNGEIDESFDLGGTCTAGVGECAAEGMLVCSADGTTAVCDAVPGEPTDELCDGLDNNCNGEIDESFDLGGTCTAGVGECAAEGMLVCSADGTTAVCDAVPGEPTDELCDGFDNNCNGEVDEGFDLGGTCTEGIGECAAEGMLVCSADGTTAVCDAVPGEPTDELCDGLDNNCNGAIDEDFDLGGTCTAGVGECAADGMLVCSADGTTSVCDAVSGEPTDEVCDGLDNNCNGAIDEDFDLGGTCTEGVGECAADGMLVCSADGTTSVCDAVSGEPTDEVCDGLDNNCNGAIDEDFDLGGTCTEGVGECAADGMLVCSADGTTSVCDAVSGEPTDEVCDGLDNNCNGAIDEDFDLGGTCTEGVGECAADGMLVCSADGTTSVCDAVSGEPTDEVCDGLDNNCNGAIDEDFDLGGTCTEGIGECAAKGMLVCTPDGSDIVCNAVPREPTDEVCDGLDNNCNGETDEDFDLGGTCTEGIGECAAKGMLVCSADGTTSVCDAVPGEPTDELCDALDNNCNGEVDEGFDLGGTCAEGIGECAADGVLVCSADGRASVCDAVPGEPTDELCDRRDNNCNGEVDEGFDLGDTCAEGIGECAADGMLVCSADGTTSVCDAVPGEPTDEMCDGLDNDCDGEIDNGLVCDGVCDLRVEKTVEPDSVVLPPAPGCEFEDKPMSLTFRYTGGGCSASDNVQDSKKAVCVGEVDGSAAVAVVAGGGKRLDPKDADDCDGKVLALKLLYTGAGCEATTNDQEGRVDCEGDAGGTEPAHVRIESKELSAEAVLFLGETLELATQGRAEFGSDTEVTIEYGLETIEFHTSCSKQLRVGDRFGSFELVELTTTDGGTASLPQATHASSLVRQAMPTTSAATLALAGPPDKALKPYDAVPAFVQPGEEFTLYPRKGKFESDSFIELINDGGTEINQLHTSCSRPLRVGDVFGSLTLVAFDGRRQKGRQVTYFYAVENAGDRLVDVTVVDDVLGTIAQGLELPAGSQISFSQVAEVFGPTTNEVTVSGVVAQTGETCSASDSATVSVVSPPGSCEDGKPRALTLRYTGESCEASDNYQDFNKTFCDGDPAGASPVRIVALEEPIDDEGDDDEGDDESDDGADPFSVRQRVWFDGEVNLFATFVVDSANAGKDKLGSATYVYVLDAENTILQEIEIHTSCSQPLNVGDQFGSLILEIFLPEEK